jgi:hypothetical protein
VRRPAPKPDRTKNLLLLLFVLSPLAVLTLLCVLIAANLSERADRARQPAPTQAPTEPQAGTKDEP